MTLYEVLFFLVHCVVHVFGYWLPCAVGAVVDLLLCRPCRTCEKKRHGYAYHPAREVRLIHHAEFTEAAVDVFGLMDSRASALEDRQYCAVSPAVPTLGKTAGAGKAKTKRNHKGRDAAVAASGAKPPVSESTLLQTSGSGKAAAHSPPEHASASFGSWDAGDTYDSQHYPAGKPSSPAPITTQFTGVNPTTASRTAAAAAPSSTPATSASTATPASHRPAYVSPEKAVKREIKRCTLNYDAPLYGPHIGTIMGAFRQPHHVQYVREEMQAWDGCYLAMDWYYVDGEAPRHYDHEHTSRERSSKAAAEGCWERERRDDNDVNEPFSGTADEASSGEMRQAHVSCRTGRTCPLPGAEAEGGGQARHDASLSHRPSVPSQGNSDDASDPQVKERCSPSTSERTSAAAGDTAVGVVFIVPGLTSHSQTNYVQHLVKVLHKAHLHVCVLSTRGMGDTPPITTPFLFNGAYTRDVRDCLQHFLTKPALVGRFGRVLPLIGVGLSIGGIILSKYVGEEGIAGADPHLDALICCCSPMDFVMTVEHMNRNGAQRAVYQHDMCSDIRNYILRYEPLQRLPNVDNDWVFAQGNIHRFRRVVHFDEHVIAKSAGYRSAHHYHIDASAVTWLPYTPIPVLAISAADDPVIGRTVMPHRWREMVRNNPRLVYAEPPVGGHLGFLGGPWSELMNRENWLECFVRDRVLAACAYWRAVQDQAAQEEEEDREKTTAMTGAADDVGLARGGRHVETPSPSPTSSTVLFSPTTAATVAPLPAKATATPTFSPLHLMQVVREVRTDARCASTMSRERHTVAPTAAAAGAPTAALNPRAGSQQAREADTSVFVDSKGVDISQGEADVSPSGDPHARPAHALLRDASRPPATTEGSEELQQHEPVQVNHAATPLAGEGASRLSPAKTSAVALPLPSARPRPIQYLPPREDRLTNRCYFTYYCTPAVPPHRLIQPYFSRTGDGRDGGAEAEEREDDDRASTSTACLDDGRSSMYAAWSSGGGGGVGGRHRSLRHEYDAGARVTGKDSRCMMVTGQHSYAPVAVNCDYVTDPRTLMADD